MTSCEAVWLRKLFSELFGFTLDTTVILYNNQRWDSIIEKSCIRRLLQQIDIIWDMVIWWARRLHHIKMMYRLIHLVKAPRKDLIRDFPKWLGVGKKPLYKGPTCCIHWALGALRACGSYQSNIWSQGDSPSLGGAHWNKMIRSLVGQDDSLSCGTGWFALLCSRMISSPVRPGLMCSPWQPGLMCSPWKL